MRQFLPLAIMGVVAYLFVVMPWHRNDPRHEFIFEIRKRLAEGAPSSVRSELEIPASEENHSSGYRVAAGHHHGVGGSHI